MFGAYKYRDHCAQLDTQLYNTVTTSAANSTTSQLASGYIAVLGGAGGVNNFHKLIYRLFASSGINTNFMLQLYSCSVSSSAISSASSNWAVIDSANLVVSALSTSASSSTLIAVLDVRPEKFSAQWAYVRPVVTYYGASASTVTDRFTVTAEAYLTDFQPASLFDGPTVVVVETDYF